VVAEPSVEDLPRLQVVDGIGEPKVLRIEPFLRAAARLREILPVVA